MNQLHSDSNITLSNIISVGNIYTMCYMNVPVKSSVLVSSPYGRLLQQRNIKVYFWICHTASETVITLGLVCFCNVISVVSSLYATNTARLFML